MKPFLRPREFREHYARTRTRAQWRIQTNSPGCQGGRDARTRTRA